MNTEKVLAFLDESGSDFSDVFEGIQFIIN